MRDFLVAIGQVILVEGKPDKFNIAFYKVRAESKEEIKEKIQTRTDFWDNLAVDISIMGIYDLEETSKLRREVEFLGNQWFLPRGS